MKKTLPRRTVVLGGARSGKSSFAERLVEFFDKPKVYIATAQAFDDEMRARIEEHKDARGHDWRLIEAPMKGAAALAQVGPDEAVLFDCATMWLSNQMLAETDVTAARKELLQAVASCQGQLVIVSNEVGLSVVPDNALARRFRDEQGALNAALAGQADLAVLVVAALPLILKGTLPEGFA
ncbi:MAG: bifunctional adenosylcobinamide kinase/adenosylcobinamide-phosphate guanylyltransferase [Rhodobacter sp.]|nr:bifunctional adenosylcobinamide kinase/adenosylcobinamide-phosphate guanylyltransferase [Rhodobacter sp.]